MISRPVAFVGLVCMLVLGRGLVTGSMAIATAGGRAVVLMAVLWFLDRTVVPLVTDVVGPPGRRQPGAERPPTHGADR